MPTADPKELLIQRKAELEAEIEPQLAAIADAQEEIRRITAALSALDGDLPTVSRPRVAPTPSNRSNGTRTRSTYDRDAIVAWVKQNPEATSGAIAEGLGQKIPSNILGELVTEGKLIKTGERRGTKYSAA